MHTKTSVGTSITEKLGTLWPIDKYDEKLVQLGEPAKATKGLTHISQAQGETCQGSVEAIFIRLG